MTVSGGMGGTYLILVMVSTVQQTRMDLSVGDLSKPEVQYIMTMIYFLSHINDILSFSHIILDRHECLDKTTCIYYTAIHKNKQ